MKKLSLFALLFCGMLILPLLLSSSPKPATQYRRTLVKEFGSPEATREFIMEMAGKGWYVVEVEAYALGMSNSPRNFFLVMEKIETK